MSDMPMKNITFSGRPKTNNIVKEAQRKFEKFCYGIQSPSFIRYFTYHDDFCPSEIRDLNYKLKITRIYRKSLFDEGKLAEYFKGFISNVKAFRVANCDEFSEIMKIILKMNKVKKCDMFAIYAQKQNETPRPLDHCVVALNVKKSQNNKKKRIPFVPKKNVKIIDMWWPNGLIGSIKKVHKLYKIFGLEGNEKLLLRPIRTLEPDKKCLDEISRYFPQLKIN